MALNFKFAEVRLRTATRFIFFPGNDAPNRVRAAAAVYWIAFLVVLVRIVIGVGVPPFGTPTEIEGALTLFVLFSAFFIFYALTIMRLSAGKIWARNVALCLTALLVLTNLYQLVSRGLSSEQNNVVGLTIIAAEAVAGLFLLTSESKTWFRSKAHT
ncbi:hypothetical protein [Paraburkholderia sp. BL21I4N1]|uniref:hypothetical protein n=1 Tax=Paraburkholderia sp. BL21I4N1 TaxID=1938801 RepID=UPI0011B2820E|nr:hypothetical protein [Paraburkholderia sp. BL21I4N1]